MIYKLEKNWLLKVVEFKATIDLSKSENIPLKKVIEFIEKYKENSLTQRFSQICINYILFKRQHPFTYLKKIPLKLIISSFNEVTNSLEGIEFTKKMDSTIKELFAFEKLINTGYEYNEKVPKKPIEDDFYLSDDNQNKYAFEVKSKQENEFCTFYLSDYLRGKMYLHNYKKNITICNFNIKIKKDYEKKIEKILSFIEPKVLIDDLIINTIDCKKHKLCVVYDKQIIDFKEKNEVDIKITKRKEDLKIVFKSQDWNLKLRIEENVTNQNITITGCKRIISDFTKTIVAIEFGKYLESKLLNLLIQYTNNKKSESRENDEFVGFLYLHIPRNWEFTSSLIKSFEELLKELKIKQKIYFSVYCFLYNSEKKNELIII